MKPWRHKDKYFYKRIRKEYIIWRRLHEDSLQDLEINPILLQSKMTAIDYLWLHRWNPVLPLWLLENPSIFPVWRSRGYITAEQQLIDIIKYNDCAIVYSNALVLYNWDYERRLTNWDYKECSTKPLIHRGYSLTSNYMQRVKRNRKSKKLCKRFYHKRVRLDGKRLIRESCSLLIES